MTEKTLKLDYADTLFLPRSSFPMRAGLPKREPELLAYWEEMDLYQRLRDDAKGRPLYVLHDGPPYANGAIHIGHALNKILKDIVIRSFQMRGFDANYVPGWDCHGLPIEWRIEEKYRQAHKNKNEVPVLEFRLECRNFAQEWIAIQAEMFKQLGIVGDFKRPYTTMAFHAEARIAGEIMKFVETGQLYRGSKPVMWSVVERTALAEAEIEYHPYISEAIFVKFAVDKTASAEIGQDLADAFVIIWTTTPWTIVANRAVSYSPRIDYGLYQVLAVKEQATLKEETFILADRLADSIANKLGLQLKRLRTIASEELNSLILIHPLRDFAGKDSYHFHVPLLAGDHVTDEAGTGFVHTAPSHGLEDFDVWTSSRQKLETMNIDMTIPFPVDDAGFYTLDAPGFGPDRVGGALRIMDDLGKSGNANQGVIDALITRDRLLGQEKITHDYPHSWRSKKPVIFRNAPQWFVALDKTLSDGTTLRSRALQAIKETRFVPDSGQRRLYSMVADRPDWVLSRQRVWGVPIALFVNAEGEILVDHAVNQRILAAFQQQGSDAWFMEGARERFLGERSDESWEMVHDIVDVWFDSGSTHVFVLKDRDDLTWPADLYLEGSDQHRGWFQSSLLESCAVYGHAPYKAVLTHGFTLDENGRKMSKSLGNIITPDEITKNYGADILRLWVATTDYREDQKLGQHILQTNVDAYRKIRNVIRWMLGTLAHDKGEEVAYESLPDLEKLILHHVFELDQVIHSAYDHFDFKRITRALLDFAIGDLSAFYFDIRKDTFYCEGPSSLKRKAALQTVREIFKRYITWLAPILPFTCEEAWLDYRGHDRDSVHLQQFLVTPQQWQDSLLAKRWESIKEVRRVVTGALEIARANKQIGSSLEAAPILYIQDQDLFTAVKDVDLAEICITSGIVLTQEEIPEGAFMLEDVPSVAVIVQRAEGKKCARSWRYTKDVGSDPDYPDVSARDAAVLRELNSLN